MNRISARLLAIFSAGFLMPSCTKESDQSSTKTNLVGSWIWARSDGGIAFNIHDTPASTGRNVELQLTSYGKYLIYTNNSLTSEGSYSLEERECIHDRSEKTYVKFSGQEGFMVEKISRDSLNVSDEAYDGIGSLYTRK